MFATHKNVMAVIPEIPPAPPQIECSWCEGSAKDDDGACSECNGTGKQDARQNIDVGDCAYAANYLRLIKSLGCNEIAPNGTGPAWFEFDEGDGLLMPIRK